jgi:hypothetical protein
MTADSHDAPSPFKGRLFIASGIFLVLVLLLLGFVVFSDNGDDNDQAAPGPSGTPDSTPTAAPTSQGDDCPKLSDTDTSVPLNAPKGVTWQLVDGYALPSSKASGPGRVDGDVAHCYARTPTGALLAAVQITGRQLSADDWESIVERQCVGDGVDYYLTERRRIEKKEGSQALTADQHGQVGGFKFITFDENTAVVDLVWRDKNGGLGAGSVTLRWSGGDWKNEITRNPAAPGGPIDSLAGYIAWGGV